MRRWDLEGRDEALIDAGRRQQRLDTIRDDLYNLEQEISGRSEFTFMDRLRAAVSILLDIEIDNASKLSIDEAPGSVDRVRVTAQEETRGPVS